jgi:DNA-binding transcriptional LysR family regulator
LALVDLEIDSLRDGAAGTYRLAAFPSIARTVVADTWSEVLAAPELGLSLRLIELEPQDSIPALRAGEVELAVTHSYSNMTQSAATGLAATELAVEPVWLAVPGRDASSTVDLEAFAGHDWVLPHRRWACHEMVQRACGLAGFTPHAVAEASDFAVLLALVSAGAGVALIPQLTIAALPDNVTLHSLSAPIVRRDWVVSREASSGDAGLRRVRDLLVASAGRRALGWNIPNSRFAPPT